MGQWQNRVCAQLYFKPLNQNGLVNKPFDCLYCWVGCCSGLPAQADQQRSCCRGACQADQQRSCCRRACQDRCCHCSATCCRRVCQERWYANAPPQDAADAASADWQGVRGAAVKEQDQTAAAAATCCRAGIWWWHSYKLTLMVTQIKWWWSYTNCPCSSKSVFIKLCGGSMLQKILKWLNLKNKIRLLDFLSPQNDNNS